MKVPLYTLEGKTDKKVELRDDIFAVPAHQAVMHQALVRQLSNARLGTHATQTRAQVSGSGRKVWRQKGTGRARQGSRTAPHWKGGGIVFGPSPERNYKQEMPKKMRRLALRSALSIKAREGKIVVVEELSVEQPKTQALRGLLKRLDVDSSALILLPERNENLERSARNLPRVKTLRANYLNLRDLLTYDWLIVPLGTLSLIEGTLAPRVKTA
ncbi:MAG: 50S ribosomal protein L4 [Chloroflexi bacterium]|nr:50S ribosomal protein L4 [Chloroflexota bacterium]